MGNFKLFVSFLFSLSNALVFSPLSPDNDVVFKPEFETKLRSFINASMECHQVPGMTLAVVKGKIDYS